MEENQKARIKILVDGNCIVCDTEVAYYKRIKPDAFDLVDISAPTFSAEFFNLENKAVNKHIHVILADGKVLKGVNAFIEIWKALGPEHSYFWFLQKFTSLFFIKPLAYVAYEAFANIRPYLPKKQKHK